MAEDMTSPEKSRIPVPEAKPLVSLETIVSPPPEKVKELTKGTWADDWRAIKEKLAPEEIPKDEQGKILRTKAVVAAAFPKASELTQEIILDVLRRQLEEAKVEVADTNVSLLPLAKNLGPLVEKLEAKPLEPAISEADKAKLRQFDLLDKAARQAGIDQGIAGALSELQKTQRALGAVQEAVNKKVAEALEKTQDAKALKEEVDELSRQLQKRNKRIETMLKDINKGEKEKQRLRAKLQEAREENEYLRVSVNAQRKTIAEFRKANVALRKKNERLERQLERRKPRQVRRVEPAKTERRDEIRVSVGAQKDIGRSRDKMEDDLGLVEPKDKETLAERGRLYVVADGAGGHLAGEVASGLAVEITCSDYYQERGSVTEALNNAIQNANYRIYREAQEAAKERMVTTIVAAVVQGDDLYVAHAGDSRAYLIRNRAIYQLTEDHSWVQERVKEGVLTPEEARDHPYRNVITRALGSKPEVKLDLNRYKINQGDIMLLCTDGLTEMVDNEKMKTLILGSPNPQVAAQRLIEQANLNGGRDNTAAIVIKVEQLG